MMLRGVILDIDGTLLLSNDAHAHSWVQAFADEGLDLPYETVKPLIGMGGKKLLPAIEPDLSAEDGLGKRLSERRQDIFTREYLPQLEPAPGARALLIRLKDEGLELTVASSAKAQELQALLRAAHVDDLIPSATGAGDVDEPKPSPDAVHAALEKLGLQADEVIMLGDSRYDVESSSRAGVRMVGVRCGGSTDEELNGVIALYNDPADILAHFEQSPFCVAAGSVSAAE